MTYKKGFTLVEILIVVVILGILAANVITTIQSNETACKENLRILRDIIQLYSAKHKNVPPGYTNNDPVQSASDTVFLQQVVTDGRYVEELPKNPFNESRDITVLGNGDSFPAEAPGDTGWIYKPAIPEIRLNWPGMDSKDVRYYDY
jgi:prepilin-type N-terminal cleavage/methylation domain-containing protein